MMPLQRHTALIPFSREHHNGLMLVLKIKKGKQFGVAPARLAPYILDVFEKELDPHFITEEEGIFLWLEPDHALRQRAFQEHAEIRALIQQIEVDTQTFSLQETFIHKLEAHIRFEERILFPHLQEHFPNRLEALALHTSASPSCHNDAYWPDHFWLPAKT
jgi:iron-sulfur cluster repair protein YtfE (RIC family)